MGCQSVAIIIPVRNGASTLEATLDSLKKAADGDSEILVVDDHSTDATTEIAQSHGCRIVTLHDGSGAGHARTEGARAAATDILLFVDSDVWAPADCLHRVRENISHRQAGCVQATFSTECPHPNFFSQYKNLYNCFVLDQLEEFIDTTYTSFTAVKRDEFFRSGGFDCQVPGASVEDRTLGRNLTRAGVKIFLDKSLKVVHNKHLSAAGFFRNQFRRSKDLAKLMLRERQSKTVLAHRRFGTNSASTMARIPVAYGLVLSCLSAALWPAAAAAAALGLAAAFLCLASGYLAFLARERGLAFACKGAGVALLDALVCGAGIATGIAEFASGKRY